MQNFIEKNLYRRSLLSYILWPISLIYDLIQRIRRFLYSRKASWYNPSPAKIVSVGNIVSGGSGKTPVTIFLAQHLRKKGYKLAVSHRGYRGDFEYDNKLVSDRKKIFSSAINAGDEVYLLARRLKGIPIIAGRNRSRSIEILSREYHDLDYIILDDSFQHLKVKHDLELIVFNSSGGIGNGFLLPAGILRESLQSLKYADLIIWNGCQVIPDYFAGYKEKVITGQYKISSFTDRHGEAITPEKIKISRLALISAIGQPLSLENTLIKHGFKFKKHYKFNDHHDYTTDDLMMVAKGIKKNHYDYIITTEKDYSKLERLDLGGIPILILRIDFLPVDINKFDEIFFEKEIE